MSFTLTLAVRDLERTALFYQEVLHLPVETFVPVPGHPPVLLLWRGDAAIVFRETATLAALHPVQFQNLDRHPLGVGVTLDFSVPKLKPILATIFRRGLHTLYELEDEEFGRREVWLHDPDGYLVILSEEEEEDAS